MRVDFLLSSPPFEVGQIGKAVQDKHISEGARKEERQSKERQLHLPFRFGSFVFWCVVCESEKRSRKAIVGLCFSPPILVFFLSFSMNHSPLLNVGPWFGWVLCASPWVFAALHFVRHRSRLKFVVIGNPENRRVQFFQVLSPSPFLSSSCTHFLFFHACAATRTHLLHCRCRKPE
jgi:hypothetical protein